MIVGPLQFDRPEWLWLLPVVVVVFVLIGRRSLGDLGGGARLLALLVRCGLGVGLGLALAEPSYRLERDDVAVTVVLDRSASMGDAGLDAGEAFVLDVAGAAEAGRDRVGVVTVGESAVAQLLPSGGVQDGRVGGAIGGGELDLVGREGSDLGAGVQLALGMTPEDAAARIVLVTEGNETEGSLIEAARAAEASGVPVDVLVRGGAVGDDVVFESLVAPGSGRSGQRVNVTAVLRSSAAVDGVLEVRAGGRPVDLGGGGAGGGDGGMRVSLVPGANRVSFTALLPEDGPVTFEGVFRADEAGADGVTRNNAQRATTFVRGEGRVLVIAADPVGCAGMVRALRSREIGVDVVGPGGGPSSLTELQGYDAVVMYDVPRRMVTGREQADLASYVHDSGGGFLMVGGPESFGAGGWIDTPIADILPVRLDPPAKRQLPRGALGLVLDNSGSMGAGVAGTGLSQLEIAAEGAVAAVRALSARDLVMVTRFDSSYEVVVQPVVAGEKGGVESAIRRITSGGGTDMMPGLMHTVRRLAEQQAAVKHVVVLSDGQTMGSEVALSRLVGLAERGGVTISTITIGDFSNDRLMEEIANRTGGTYYPVTTAKGVARLPEIFIKEAQLVRRSLIWEGSEVLPVVTAGDDATLAGLGGLPGVTGYVVTADRGGASLVTSRVQTDPDVADPLTARWQHGLGRVGVVTTDAGARWATGWPGWAGYVAFWEQQLRWVMRPAGSANVRVATRNEGGETRVTVTALDDAGEPVNFGLVRGTVTHDDGRGVDSRGLSLRQTGPGRYEGSFVSEEAGTYLLALGYESVDGDAGAGGARGTVTASVERAFADEYRVRGVNAGLLERVASVTGGRVLSGDVGADGVFSRAGLSRPVALTPVWLWLVLAGVGVLLIDVGIRRVRLSPGMLLGWVRGLARESERAGTASVGGLREARVRAQSRLDGGREVRVARRESARRAREVASRKYEASEERRGVAAGPVVDEARGVVDDRRVGVVDGGAGADDGEEGLSRLMAAKRRAREERMSDGGAGS